MSRQGSSSADAIVWDLPLRVFHWALVGCVIVSVASAKMGVTAVHERSGLAVLGLILFRIIWGFIGSQTARFSSFVKNRQPPFWPPPATFWQVKQITGQAISALGGYATLILLAVCLVNGGYRIIFY